MTPDDSPSMSRRRLLQTGVGGGIASLCGCLSTDNNVGGDEDVDIDADGDVLSPTIPPASVIESLSFDGSFLMVELADDNEVTALQLQPPDMPGVIQKGVAAGSTTVSIQILRVQSGLGGFEHYEPGRYELVAVGGETDEPTTFEMWPDVHIVDVEQYQGGEEPEDAGKIAVTIENRGSAPTWIHDIAYRNAPNETANRKISGDIADPRLSIPNDEDDLIIEPWSRKRFVGDSAPFLFDEQATDPCGGVYNVGILAGVASGEQITQTVTVATSGPTRSIGTRNRQRCETLSIVAPDGIAE